jgi:hypothetical protein
VTNDEIKFLVALIDVAVKTAGVQIFQDNGGLKMHSIMEKLDAQLEENDLRDKANDA